MSTTPVCNESRPKYDDFKRHEELLGIDLWRYVTLDNIISGLWGLELSLLKDDGGAT